MNNVTLVGRLTNNPELRYVGESQSAVAEIILAVDRKYKDKDGMKKTDFIRVEMWGKRAEVCSQYLKKGNMIGVEGSIKVEKYQTTSGESRSITKINVSNFNFLDSKNKSQSTKNDKQGNYYEASNVFEENGIGHDFAEEELPF